MSIAVKHRRDSKANLDTVTPAEAEIGFDQTRKKFRFGDGAQLGGFRLQRENWRDTASFAIAANTDNWAPTAFEELGVLIITATAAYNITGLVAGSLGRDIEIRLDSAATGAITIKHQSASSTAANRIICPNARDVILTAGQSLFASYDTTSSRWLVETVRASTIAVVSTGVQQEIDVQAVIDTIAGRLPRVIARSTLAPPGSPTNGDSYIVPASATGAWATQTDKIATWSAASASWVFTTPATDQYVLSVEDQRLLRYSGGWVLPRTNFYLANELSPAQIAADQANYNPTGFYLANVIRFSADASGRKFTGLAGGDAGQYKIFVNIGTTNVIFSNEDAGSTAANRLTLGKNITVRPNESIAFRYDSTLTRWLPIARSVMSFNEFQGELFYTAIISPAIAANANDWAPAGFATANTVFLAPTASFDVTGLAGGADGREVTFFNRTAFTVTFREQSASSSAANRFAFGGDMPILPNQSTTLRYDAISSRWIAQIGPSSIALSAIVAAILAGSSAGVSDSLANTLTTALAASTTVNSRVSAILAGSSAGTSDTIANALTAALAASTTVNGRVTALLVGSAAGVSDTLANVLTTANGNAAGLAIALG